MIRTVMGQVPVTPETLDVDTIKSVGVGGEYLTHDHTLEYFKSDHWNPRLGNTLAWDKWQKSGATDIRSKARQQVKKILATHQPKPLDPEVQKKLQQIVDEAEA